MRNFTEEQDMFREAYRKFIEAEQLMFQSSSTIEKRLELSWNAVERHLESIAKMAEIDSSESAKNPGILYRHYWRRINRQVGLPT